MLSAVIPQPVVKRNLHRHVLKVHIKASDEAPTTSSNATTTSPDKAALLARIARAKQYKQSSSSSSSSSGTNSTVESLNSSPPPAAPPNRDSAPSTRPPTDWGAMAAFLDAGGRPGPQSVTAGGSSTSAGQEAPSLGGLAPGPPSLLPEDQQAEAAAALQRARRFEGSWDKLSEEPSPADTDISQLVLNSTQAPGRGSASQPADFLARVLEERPPQEGGAGAIGNMRMEEYTTAREASIKQRGAEILTVDASYRPGAPSGSPSGPIVATTRNADAAALLLGPQAPPPPPPLRLAPDPLEAGEGQGPGEGQAVYQPKVTTWGVFPRPKDISKEFGGGRNLAPGQELESAAQRAAREEAYAQALRSYRDKMGLELDPGLEAEAEALYAQGMELFGKAELQAAYDLFNKALGLVPLKSRVGGLAGMQAAIILDSQGLSEPAQKLYRQLQGHAVASVSRKAKQMLFGFKAAVFLKADQITYAPRKEEYARFFRPLADRNKIWVASEADRLADEESARAAALVAVAVLLGPLGLMAALVTSH
ncbi:hypothetical protein V8C86DRAFT_2613023 [Haematococcus lacustris]